jgi:ABC-type transport system involved in cytochrome c biogenesis permease subunit
MTPTQVDPIARPVAITKPAPSPLWTMLKPLASLRLTVVLLAFAIGLVFFGTLAQKTSGLWTVVDKYFWSWIVMIDLQPLLEFGKIFFGLSPNSQAPSWAQFPFPGGKLIGGLMFINLLAAHIVRFKFTWKRIGIWMAHSGILLLFVGEAITRECQVEQRMTIPEGQAVNFTEDARLVELAFTCPDTDGTERMTVIPGARLAKAARTRETISHPNLPVDIRVDAYMTNSALLGPRQIAIRKADKIPVPENPATAGLGLDAVAEQKPEVSGVGEQTIDLPAAYLTLFRKGTDEKIGTYLVSLWYTHNPFGRDTEEKQSVKIDGTDYDLALRYTRYYKPFSFYLKIGGFRFDRYTGTQEAKNYSSDLILIDPEREQHRDVHIEMNDPLRYRGETFYQQNFDRDTEKTTVLQVVRNPGWRLPYLSCALVGLGLLLHFVLGLSQFLTRQKKPTITERGTTFERCLPWGVVALGVLMLIGAAMPKSYSGNMPLGTVARLPVVDGGRVKPLDTVARVYLRKISAREEYLAADGKLHPAIEWLLDAMASPPPSGGPAWKHRVIRIENEQVLSLLGLERREGYRFSLEEVSRKIDLLQAAVDKVRPREGAPKPKPNAQIDRFFESSDRDVFAAQVLEAAERIELYTKLCARSIPLTLPPTDGKDWRSLGDLQRKAEGEAVRAAMAAHNLTLEDLRKLNEQDGQAFQEEIEKRVDAILQTDPTAMMFGDMISAYREGNSTDFGKALTVFQKATESGINSADRAKGDFEVFLNEFAPAYQVIYLYVLAGLLSLGGWVAIGFRPLLAESMRKSAFRLLILAFAVHAFALFARMYLMDRPLVFVTNLYSTAVFIGWAAVGLGLFVERIAPLGLGNLAAAVVGGATAILAHNLATSGDTLTMMEAVLDTNFWLATHVTTINLGYAATYFAGVLGIVYIVLGLFTPALGRAGSVPAPVLGGTMTVSGPNLGRILGQVMYGVICLATLLSFVGTVLGGIWADQSWGRFWGWDPKENGAVLIVVWNALILHARWCGLVKDRGVAVLALVGNMITTWSYFGTNQLGVGLHAYGFNKTLATGCMVTWIVHVILIGLGSLPLTYWRSFSGTGPLRTETISMAGPIAPSQDTPHLNGKGRKHGKKR